MDDPENAIPSGASTPFLVRRADGRGFTLPFSDPLTSSRSYPLQWTILPSKVANIPCAGATPTTLLERLNFIFETKFPLTPDLAACLTEFIDDGCDIGQVYGYSRPWWPFVHHVEDFCALPAAIRKRRQKDYGLRSAAINSNHITNPRIPPRRVWDLYANRVLPYHAMRPKTDWGGEEYPPDNLWAVSHSWVAPAERQSVLTTINGKAWRVPIPRGTTINDIRNELLLLGAEYVFLDVLCLRQKDELLPEFESIRKREWRLDIPTIGYIFNQYPKRPVIIYFNGLGLPFRDGPVDPGDHLHWFNRVWTLQETPSQAIFGGLKSKLGQIDISDARSPGPLEMSGGFFEALKSMKTTNVSLHTTLRTLAARAYSNPVDQVSCLAYLLGCATLPIYDADIDVEVAWGLLVECLPDVTRTILLFSDFGPRRISESWRPTWKQVKACRDFQSPSDIKEEETLKHLDGSSSGLGYRHGFDAYYQKAYIIENCRIRVRQILGGENEHEVEVEVPSAREGGILSFRISQMGKTVLSENTSYLLVSVGNLMYWVVAVEEGVQRIHEERALEVSKVSTLTISDPSANYRRFIDYVLKSKRRLIVYK